MNKTGFIQFNRVERSRMFGPFYFMTETKVRKTRTPKNGEQIVKGALALLLEDRVMLRSKLDESITAEVERLKAAASNAALVAGINS